MISSGVHVNSVDTTKTGNTALHWAASFGNEFVVRCLLFIYLLINPYYDLYVF